MPASQVLLVTGSSSGIGLATALEAARRGHRVYASARRPEALPKELAAAGAAALELDVEESGAAARAVAEILAREGRLDALVSNAGYAQYGATEDVSLEEWRRQFQVNFFGALEVIRAVLPAMRTARRGTIAVVTSVAGRITIPFAAPYCASKHALESLCDSLRVEVAPFGIRVVCVEPGPIATRFDDRALERVQPILGRAGPYSPIYPGAERAMKGDFQIGKLPPESVARVVLDAVESTRPRTRYRVTSMSKILIPLRALLPDRLFDAAIRMSLKIPKRL